MGAVCIASLLAVPSLTVLGSLSQPSSDVWVHLWRTQLLELIANTLAIAVWARTSESLWSAAAPALAIVAAGLLPVLLAIRLSTRRP
ncbi:MAG: hypothetical protein DMD94_01905 [Candidatus Rokuibacteriota bacterium]|nr:MAG: hypothetical protein DMD94_01905 [Candidatus Rokubacteria bacterium]